MMKARLTGTALSLASLALLAAPAMAGYRVKVPTGGDLVSLTVHVVNNTSDYVTSAHYAENETGSGFHFVSYQDFSVPGTFDLSPFSSGDITFEVDAFDSFPEVDNFQLPLTGFGADPFGGPDFESPVFTYDDPGLKISIVSEDTPCYEGGRLDPKCVLYALPVTITIPADGKSPVPEAGTAVSFGIGLLGLVGVMLYGRRNSPALKSQALKSPNASV